MQGPGVFRLKTPELRAFPGVLTTKTQSISGGKRLNPGVSRTSCRRRLSVCVCCCVMSCGGIFRFLHHISMLHHYQHCPTFATILLFVCHHYSIIIHSTLPKTKFKSLFIYIQIVYLCRTSVDRGRINNTYKYMHDAPRLCNNNRTSSSCGFSCDDETQYGTNIKKEKWKQ